MSNKLLASLSKRPGQMNHNCRLHFFKMCLLAFISFFCFGKGMAQVSIPSMLLGENAWFIDPSNFNVNALDWNAIQTSGVKSMRIGGNNFNSTPLSEANLKTLVQKIRQTGIEPLVQVAYDPNSNLITQATNAATLVHDLNTDPNSDYHVTYWIISNEPDNNFGYVDATGADLIENYTREYSTRMKAQDGNIKIIGPELATYYDTYAVYLALTNSASTYPTANATNILPYIDIFSYHIYPFGDENTTATGYNIPPTRENVARDLSGIPAPATFANSANTNPFRNALSQIRTRLSSNGGSAIDIAVTEANICYFDDVGGASGNDDNITGTGANSFIAGQFWAETYLECERANIKFLNYWSVKEGQAADSYKTNIGYINSDPSKFGGAGGLKPTYFHVEMLAENFSSGTFYPVTPESGNADSHVKAYVCTNGGSVKVLVLNEEVNSTHSSASNKSISIHFSNSAPTGNGNYKFHTDVTVPGLSFTELTIPNIDNESTWVFQYNSSGTLTNQCFYKLYDATYPLTYHCDVISCNPPTANASSNSPVCQSAAINLSATTVSGATYSWQGPDGWTNSTQTPSRTGATVAMAGTYTLTVTLNGCSATATTFVDVPDFASIGVGGPTTFCANQGRNVVLYAATGSGYSWQWVKDGTNIPNANADTYTVSVTGSYQVKITRPTNCNAWSAPTQVTANTTQVATITPQGATTVCSPSTVLLYGNTCDNYTYQWQKKDVNGVYQPISGATTASYVASTSGWYQLRTTLSGNNVWSSGVQVTINSCRMANPDTTATLTEAEPDLSVYPNPANDQFTITIASMKEENKNIDIEIMNSLGQTVYRSSYNAVKESSFQSTIDLDKVYGNGLYIIRATIGNTVMYSRVVLSR